MQADEPQENRSNEPNMDAEPRAHVEAALHYLQISREILIKCCEDFQSPILMHYKDQVELAIEGCLGLFRNSSVNGGENERGKS